MPAADSGLIDVWAGAEGPDGLDTPDPDCTGEATEGVGLPEGVAASDAAAGAAPGVVAGAVSGVAAGVAIGVAPEVTAGIAAAFAPGAAAGTGVPTGALAVGVGDSVFCAEAGPDEVAGAAESVPGLLGKAVLE